MAELALGVAGIVPLIGGAIKAYKEVKRKLKLFRHRSKETKKLQKVLRIQRQVFANECRLWLKFVIEDDDIAADMVSDADHDGWRGPDLDASLRSRLHENYDTWHDITAEISQSISTLEADIMNLEERTKAKSGKLKNIVRKGQEGVKVALNAATLEKTLDKLRSSNNELKGLREQVVETHRVQGEVQMNLALVCRNHTREMLKSTLVQLEVRSQNLEWIEPKLPGQLSSTQEDGSASHKRLKVVRFAETAVQTRVQSNDGLAHVSSGQSTAYESCDLGLSKDICKELTRQLNAKCLGHLDVHSDEAFRHSFYPAKDSFCKGALHSPSTSQKVVAMDEVLDDSSRDFFSTLDRLRLARSLVTAVLKFHSTPWLSEFWRLRDLAFFKAHQSEEVSEALRTLHLRVEVTQHQLYSMEDVQASSDSLAPSQISEDERLFCGIDNSTLHSLGVALLQIGRWTRVEPEDVLKVRKLALRASSLGPRYHEITQKCLRCDFGYGSDLTKPRLQEAVYENVIGALETMISSLELADD
ncbi:hypothetical protein CCHR01_05326 [Colletotrichum chrysophilum]|uniref:DUF7580 domain-containing protein n=1 Tax=Colletotrichum chrysophilum TaxID=1836956 RepID=A0AAD9APM2_9PEZI|nr:hypothetical protein CCHR01_05326 [Colletotrichum chrysophilum]